jgi:hypothetical protein
VKPTERNIGVILNPELSNSQKIATLTSREKNTESDYYQARLGMLVERLKKIAYPVDDGIDPVVRPNRRPSNFQTDRLKVAQIDDGNLMLDIFVYYPGNLTYGRSVYAKWQLDQAGQSHTVLEEYLSNKSFIPGIAAHKPDAPKILSLIEDTLSAYENAAGLRRTFAQNVINKFLELAFKDGR